MIRFEGVTKYYKTKQGRNFVLNDVTLEFSRGKNIGILGRNGAGKSTLLRLMGGIEFPNKGRIETEVKMSWPLGLTGGFQGSLSGRENCKFVCRIFGASEEEIVEKIGFIEEFAGIGAYFEMPVKTYSSGMRSRLAFAMSMAFDFDCYLIDEIVSVGDKAFRAKCKQALDSIRERATVVMVSHDMSMLHEFCDIGVVLNNGELLTFDTIDQAIAEYTKL